MQTQSLTLPTVRTDEPETPVYGSLLDMVHGRTMGDDARDACDIDIDFSMSIDFDYR